ncbi:Clp amino terminal domain-containing protein, pathogenicity island component [Lentzea fradiae]|uniref:Clp amino terminal domain-containing protein, pathogenicity island component n=1 Tax=Lentzea fradiae TaxID=200378 RepID=A0A1G7MIF6_9PSEU|nr:Clp protease N-terminal domain-containing protein [Lentzea fradiae]SDF61464.1 Clp amino terminal domain-containing protein, pathogenicity island component [Lentzea fradiae]
MIAERFTREAREAVKAAVREAEETHAAEVGVEHLLLALLDAPVLAGFDLPRDELVAAFRDYRRKGGLTKADAEALRGLGIDVDQVIDSVEQSLGAGVLRPGPRRRWFGMPLEPASKKALERSLREARDLRHNYLGTEHILMALLQGSGIVAEVLTERGVTYEEIRKRAASARAT